MTIHKSANTVGNYTIEGMINKIEHLCGQRVVKWYWDIEEKSEEESQEDWEELEKEAMKLLVSNEHDLLYEVDRILSAKRWAELLRFWKSGTVGNEYLNEALKLIRFYGEQQYHKGYDQGYEDGKEELSQEGDEEFGEEK